MKGVDDLDFFIGDEAIDKPNYATKVWLVDICIACILPLEGRHSGCVWRSQLLHVHMYLYVFVWHKPLESKYMHLV